jgi:hypothetical protein
MHGSDYKDLPRVMFIVFSRVLNPAGACNPTRRLDPKFPSHRLKTALATKNV